MTDKQERCRATRGVTRGLVGVWCVVALCMAGALGVSAQAHAQSGLEALTDADREALIEHLRVGNEAFDKGNYEGALAAYDKANALAQVAEIAYRRGLCLERLERYAEAIEAYEAFLKLDPNAQERGRVEADVARLKAKVRKSKVALVEIQTEPAGATVWVGSTRGRKLGKTPLNVEMKAGKYTLFVQKEGYEPRREVVAALGGQRNAVSYTLLPEGSKEAVLEVDVTPEGATVRDGSADGEVLGEAPLALKRKPGEGAVHISKEGYRPRLERYTLKKGQTLALKVALKSEDEGGGTFGIGLGVTIAGGALLLASGGLWFAAESAIADANDYSRTDPANSRGGLDDIQAPIDGYKAGTYITGGLGAAALATGVVLMLIDGGDESADATTAADAGPRLGVQPTPGGAVVGVGGAF